MGTGWQVGFGNIGSFISTFAFLPGDAPRYIPGYSICIAFAAFSALACTAYFISCWYQNRQRDRRPSALSLTEYEKTELGDMSPDYRYQL